MFEEGKAMTLKILRFIGILCAALTLGLTVTHVLEIPGKRELSGEMWLIVQHSFYGGFAIIGGVAEVLGFITTIAILFLTWKNRRIFFLTLVGAFGFMSTLLTYWIGNRPINFKIAQWTQSTLPGNWETYRDYWDLAHSITAVFSLIAFVFLMLTVLGNSK